MFHPIVTQVYTKASQGPVSFLAVVCLKQRWINWGYMTDVIMLIRYDDPEENTGSYNDPLFTSNFVTTFPTPRQAGLIISTPEYSGRWKAVTYLTTLGLGSREYIDPTGRTSSWRCSRCSHITSEFTPRDSDDSQNLNNHTFRDPEYSARQGCNPCSSYSGTSFFYDVSQPSLWPKAVPCIKKKQY